MKKRLFGLFISFLVVLIAFGITASADTTDTPDEEIAEVIWGTSATDLGGEGTLADALFAAYEDSTIKYIKLQTDVFNADLLNVDFYSDGRELTIDLAGHAISTESSNSIFDIHHGNVTITSTARGAALNATYGGFTYGIRVVSTANVTVDNVYVTSTGNCIYVMETARCTVGEGAILESIEGCVVNAQGDATVKGTLIPRSDGYAEIDVSFDAIVDLSECKSKAVVRLSFYDTTLPLDEIVILGEGEQLVNMNTRAPDEYPENYYTSYEIPLYYDVYVADAEGNKTKIDTVYKNTEYPAPEYELTAPEGKVCIGWCINGDGLTPDVYFGERFTVIDDITLFPVFANDAIYVGGVELPCGKYLAAGADTATDTKPEGGYAYYADGTLTLDNYTYTGLGYLFNIEELIYENEEDDVTLTFYALIYSEFAIKIKLVGENALVSSYYATPEAAAADTYYAGITLKGNRLDISGGALTLSSVNDGAINLTNGGNMTVTDARLTLNALEATLDSDGIDINGEGGLTVKNSTLVITTTEDAVELEDGGYVTITDSTVTITAGDDGIEIDSYGAIAIERSTLTADCDYIPLKSDDGVFVIITDSTLDLTSKEGEGIYTCYDVYVTDSDVKLNARFIGIYTDYTFNCTDSKLVVTSAESEGIFAYGAFIADSDVTATSALDAIYVNALIVTGKDSRLSLTSATSAVSSFCAPYFDNGIDLGYKVIESTDSVGNSCYSLAGADGNAVKTLTVTPKPVESDPTPDPAPDPTPDTTDGKSMKAGTAVLITVIALVALEALAAAVIYVLVLKPRGITLKSIFGKRSDDKEDLTADSDTAA